MGAQGISVISFGATPATEATVVVPMPGILAGSLVEFFVMANQSTPTNDTNAHDFASLSFRPTCTAIVAGVSATAKVTLIAGMATGDFDLCWVWN